ncbi:MetQ/NlpA family ABC transporter substrate-binding protein [Chlamydiota bacterium]
MKFWTQTCLWAGLLTLFLLSGCHMHDKTLTVAASAVPHAEILEAAKPALEKEGIHLKIVEVDDWNLPNRLLYEKQVDANFFQHKPYLEEQNRRFGYNLQPLVSVHIEPLGIYSKRIHSLSELKAGSTIAIPSDPTNEARALALLADLKVIQLKPGVNTTLATLYDIAENPKNLKIQEIDAPFLPRTLSDVDAAVIPVNFALQAGLNPTQDALALEPADSPYANIVAIREGDAGREDLQKLKEALTSEEMRQFIIQKYHGAILPAF